MAQGDGKILGLKEYNGIGPEEEAAVVEVIRSGKLSGFIAGPPGARDMGENGGKWVRTLEREWAQRYGVKHALSFNSATSALMASVVATTREGEYVCCPAWTMSATASAAVFVGRQLCFADIEPQTYCIDPDDVARSIRHGIYNPRAVVAVNLFGHTARLAELEDICRRRVIPLIEDSAQTPLARDEHGRRAGTFGQIGVYSLNRHKHIHCGEGGIAVTDDDDLAQRMRSVRNHGIAPLGLNLRMTELEAAVATVQLRNIDRHVSRARKLGKILTDELSSLCDVSLTRDGCEHDYYLWSFRTKDQDRISKNLDARGVPHIKGYIQPLNRIFADVPCPVTERLREELICFECCKYDIEDPTELLEAFRAALG